MKPQELKMVCGELNGINRFVFNRLEKICLLLIRSEKIVCTSWELEKSLIM